MVELFILPHHILKLCVSCIMHDKYFRLTSLLIPQSFNLRPQITDDGVQLHILALRFTMQNKRLEDSHDDRQHRE